MGMRKVYVLGTPQGDACEVPVNRRKVIAKWRNSDRHFKREGAIKTVTKASTRQPKRGSGHPESRLIRGDVRTKKPQNKKRSQWKQEVLVNLKLTQNISIKLP
jgi:hypothetical protein